MSRAPGRNDTPQRGAGEEDEICPVCKSSRYLNPNMRFLVNPECYHKMCESCVDRIFSQGPAPCPVAGCARTLRKQRFRKQTFEDLQIEREVDIRRRVASTFNRRESEFQTLLDYNNYLEEVETLTFNLLNNIDLTRTEATLDSYAKQNAQDIASNSALSAQENASTEANFAAQKEQAKLRREAARKEDVDERMEREEGRREVLEKIRRGDADADKTTKVGLKKPSGRRPAIAKERQQAAKADNGAATPLFQIQGLKPVEKPKPEEVYDPFDGYVLKQEYYLLQPQYDHSWLDKARTDTQIRAGGYDVTEYCTRAMLEAFAGLGIFVEEEVAGRDEAASKVVGTESAALAVGYGKDGVDVL